MATPSALPEGSPAEPSYLSHNMSSAPIAQKSPESFSVAEKAAMFEQREADKSAAGLRVGR